MLLRGVMVLRLLACVLVVVEAAAAAANTVTVREMIVVFVWC